MSYHSEFLVDGFTPNPFYDKFMSLLRTENHQLLEDIVSAASLSDLGDFGNDFDPELIEALVLKFDDQLDDILDTFEECPMVLPNMPPAPVATTLYGRVNVDTPVLDLGSGDGRKAEKARIDDVVLTDLIVPPGRFSRKWKKLDVQDENKLKLLAGDRVLTSHMSLCQVRDLLPVLNMDGIHIVPDLTYLSQCGAEDLGDRLRVRARNKVYEDFKHDYEGATYNLSHGYLGVVTYAEQDVWVELGGAVRIKPPRFIMPSVVAFNTDPNPTPKYDGREIMFQLRKDGTGIASNRAGMARKLRHNLQHNCLFTAEHVKNSRSSAYVLLRVYSYRGFVPWHSVGCLRQFTKRKKFDIGGDRLLSPGDPDADCYPSDGLIMRRGEEDFRVKGYVGVDLDQAAWGGFQHYFNKNCEDFVIDEPPEDKRVVEYIYSLKSGIHTFKKKTERTDKTAVTSVSEFLFLTRIGN